VIHWVSAQMGRRKRRAFSFDEAVEFLNHLIAEKPLLPFLIPLIFLAWAVERWDFSFSNWVPLVVAVWAATQVQAPCGVPFLRYYIFSKICFFLFSFNLFPFVGFKGNCLLRFYLFFFFFG